MILTNIVLGIILTLCQNFMTWTRTTNLLNQNRARSLQIYKIEVHVEPIVWINFIFSAKSSKNSRRSKETKNSSVHNENVQEYGAISNDVIEKDSPIPAETSRHLEHYPYVSHDSVKYLFKNRIGQGRFKMWVSYCLHLALEC